MKRGSTSLRPPPACTKIEPSAHGFSHDYCKKLGCFLCVHVCLFLLLLLLFCLLLLRCPSPLHFPQRCTSLLYSSGSKFLQTSVTNKISAQVFSPQSNCSYTQPPCTHTHLVTPPKLTFPIAVMKKMSLNVFQLRSFSLSYIPPFSSSSFSKAIGCWVP